MHCTSLRCCALYLDFFCTALNRAVSCAVPHCTALFPTAMSCTALHGMYCFQLDVWWFVLIISRFRELVVSTSTFFKGLKTLQVLFSSKSCERNHVIIMNNYTGKISLEEVKVDEQGWRSQWWERSPPLTVFRVRFPDCRSHVGWVGWFSTLLRGGRFSGNSSFPVSSKTSI